MNLNYLKEFVTLASYFKLTSAARAMYMSPSTLSQHIAALEKEVGCELFSRTNGFTLTREGEAALEHAQKILYEYGALLRDCSTGEGTTMRLSIPNYYFGQETIACARRKFFEEHPNTKVIITTNEHQGDDPFTILEDGLSDVSALYVVRNTGQRIENLVPEGVEYMRIGAYRVVLVPDDSSPYLGQEEIRAIDLDGASLVLRLCPVTAVLMEGVNEVFEQANISVRVLFRQFTRNMDVFLDELGENTYMTWFEPVEGSLGGSKPGKPTLRFEHDIVADAYVLYRPDLLDELQLGYLRMVAQILKEGIYSPETEEDVAE